MSWVTKELTLDLLSIGIHALVKMYDAIDKPIPDEATATADAPETPDVGQDEVAEQPAVENEEAPAPQTSTAATDEAQQQAPVEASPAPANTLTMPEIQNALRTIAQEEGTPGLEWIQNKLFKGFGITNITHLPDDKFPLAWELINDHLAEAKESA